MRRIDRFRADSGFDAGPGKAALIGAGSAPQFVPGTHIEAQYAVEAASEPSFLVLTSYNSPFEEMIHILLLDGAGRLVERAKLGRPYAPGILKELRVVSPERLTFDFQGPVAVTVHAKPRGWFRRRRLQVTRAPSAEEVEP